MKKVVLLGDLHCGHITGLTPPGWQSNPESKPALKAMQQEMWTKYRALVRQLGPVDVLIVNGDIIDGKGSRSGGTELLCTDLFEQGDMAVKALQIWNPDKTIMTFGTPYHTATASGEDVERVVAEKLDAEIHSHAFVDVEGVMFDVKHKVGSSSVPHGRSTAVNKERLWNVLWNEMDGQPNADVYVRSHVHYFGFSGGADWLAITLPALQGPHTKFGARQCSGTVDWGVVTFTVDKGKVLEWRPEILRLNEFKAEVIKV
jgi:hypothetical protein